MFDSCVLGVDPGLAAVGLATVARRDRRPELLWARTVRTDGADREERRLAAIYRAVRDAIDDHGASSMAVERVAWNRNVTSGLQVARATGVMLLAAADAGIEVAEYGPLEVKMAVTGVGNADKRQVHAALDRAHGLRNVPSQPDAADAVAVALCHVTQVRLRRATERTGAR
jgi:crossover junction endodeoxyribonuclease RuvC